MQRATGNSERQSRLCNDLDRGLHAMAQPLTVLRGTLGALIMRGNQDGNSTRHLEMSNKQVDRLCELLRCMQNLLNIYQFDAASSHFTAWQLIAPVLEEYSSVLQDAGVRLEVSMPDQAVRAMGDPARTAQAVQAGLAAAATLSSKGDVIQLELAERSGFIEMTLENRNAHTKSLTSFDRLNLSMAEESIRSQKGCYECSENPFRVSFRLPLNQEPETKIGTALDCAPQQEIHSSIC